MMIFCCEIPQKNTIDIKLNSNLINKQICVIFFISYFPRKLCKFIPISITKNGILKNEMSHFQIGNELFLVSMLNSDELFVCVIVSMGDKQTQRFALICFKTDILRENHFLIT